MSNPPAVRPPARANRKGLERMSPPGKRSRVGTWGRVKGTRRRAGGREGREEREDGKTGGREDGRTDAGCWSFPPARRPRGPGRMSSGVAWVRAYVRRESVAVIERTPDHRPPAWSAASRRR